MCAVLSEFFSYLPVFSIVSLSLTPSNNNNNNNTTLPSTTIDFACIILCNIHFSNSYTLPLSFKTHMWNYKYLIKLTFYCSFRTHSFGSTLANCHEQTKKKLSTNEKKSRNSIKMSNRMCLNYIITIWWNCAVEVMPLNT